jgi:hypothetical protein
MKSAKILGLALTDDLKWNEHVLQIVKKARKRLYCLAQLKWSNVGTKELLQFYITCIRPITEYACLAFHNSLTNYLSNDLEPIQKRALRMDVLQWGSVYYSEALSNKGHKLHKLLPPCNNFDTILRNKRRFNVTFKTERYRNNFITYNALKS